MSDTKQRELANQIYFSLVNLGFEFDGRPLSSIDQIADLITDDTDLKQVVLYVIHNLTK
jgi:hypothetical protein